MEAFCQKSNFQGNSCYGNNMQMSTVGKNEEFGTFGNSGEKRRK